MATEQTSPLSKARVTAPVHRDIRASQARGRNPYGLTIRELQVLQLVARGSRNRDIAAALGISLYTVNKHVSRILARMDVQTRTEAGAKALLEELIDLAPTEAG